MRRSVASSLVIVSLVIARSLLLAACDGGHARRVSSASGATQDAAVTALVPREPGSFAPSQAHAAGAVDVNAVANTASCDGCHADASAQWQNSAHARSSFDNPWYRSVVDRVRAEIGFEASQHCGGCHDPLLTFSDRMRRDVEPHDALANGGVTCLVCHGITETRPDGNGSYTLSSAPVPIPEAGNAESIEAHRRRLAPSPLRTAGLCASCHRGFLGTHTGLPHHLTGIEEPGPWRASAYAGNEAGLLDDDVERADCAGCHMRDEAATRGDRAARDGSIRSHRFAGAHTAIAGASRDPAQLAALEAQLARSVTLDIAAIATSRGGVTFPAEHARLGPGDHASVDVVVRNVGVGHRFPGGVKDMQDTWLEVRVDDARGQTIASAGSDHAEHEDESAYVFRAVVVDEEGHPETQHLVHRFRALAYDHTIAPRDARVIRYELSVPLDAVPPLRIEATIHHRRHREEARALACEATRSARGHAFARMGEQLFLRHLDGCAPEPITLVARAAVTLDGSHGDRPLWRRAYDHGLGLLADTQEHLEAARTALHLALGRVEDDPRRTARSIAQIENLLGRVAAREGRTNEALDWARRAEERIGSHPAIDRVRADAFAQVWRWPEAERALTAAASRAPGDTSVWRDLARARVAIDDPRGSLEAVRRGFALQPRDEGLLRAQTLALERFGHAEAPTARATFLRHRDPDGASDLRMACDGRTPNCERDRAPITVIPLHR